MAVTTSIPPYADLELQLLPPTAGACPITLRFALPGSDTAPDLLRDRLPLVAFDLAALRRLALDADAYGRALGAMLFADPDLLGAWREARGMALVQGGGLRLRLRLPPAAPTLHALHWETLWVPGEPGCLAQSDHLLFSRYLESTDRTPVTPRSLQGLTTLVVAANPHDLAQKNLAPVDVVGEIARARVALEPSIPVTTLAPGEHATLDTLERHLRGGAAILYLACHGQLVDGQPYLVLEDETGAARRVAGQELALRLTQLHVRPQLIVLAACASAGSAAPDTTVSDSAASDVALTAAGPLLVAAGIPAVVAMHGRVSMATVARCLPAFFADLAQHGVLDLALAAARRRVQDRPDWWAPVLYMRLRSGRLFAADKEETAPPFRVPFRVPFLRNPFFVGREQDLANLHAALTSGSPVGIRSALPAAGAGLTGMGGIGKTQLAVEYCYRFRDAYPGGVFWLNAAGADWRGEFADLGRILGPGPGRRARHPPHPRRRRLSQRPPGLPPGARQRGRSRSAPQPRHRRPCPRQPPLPHPAHHPLARAGRRAARRGDRAARGAGAPVAAARPHPPTAAGPRPSRTRRGPAHLRHPGLSCRLRWKLPAPTSPAARSWRRPPTAASSSPAAPCASSTTPAAVCAPSTSAPATRPPSPPPSAASGTPSKTPLPICSCGWPASSPKPPLSPSPSWASWPACPPRTTSSSAPRSTRPWPSWTVSRSIERLAGDTLRLHPLVREFAQQQTPAPDTPDFRRTCALNLLGAYQDVAELARQCAQRGVDALEADLNTALSLLPVAAAEDLYRPLLRQLLRMLQHESHVLRGWNPAQQPAFFLQQWRKRALVGRDPRHAQAAAAALARLSVPHLELLWTTAGESAALERTLSGHTDLVNAVAVTADGQRAVSASADKTLKVWDLASGAVLHTLCGHTDPVTAVAVTADGQRAVSASDDYTLKVWDLASGAELHTLSGHTRSVNAVAVTADGQRAVSASHDHTLKVWDLASGAELHTLSGHTGWVNAVAVTADGQRAVSASDDHTLKVWDLASGAELHTLSGHTDSVSAVAVTADGQRAVSASWDNTLKVWDLASGAELHTLSGHTGWVSAVAVTADGQRAVSASRDSTLKVWDLASGAELHTLSGHTDWVNAVAVTADGQRAVSASVDNTLKVWDLVRGAELHTLSGHTDWVSAVAVTADGQRAVSASGDHTLKVWDLASGAELHTLSGHTDSVSAVAVTADGQRAVSASCDDTLKVWDLASGAELHTLSGHTRWVSAVAVTADGQRAVSASGTTRSRCGTWRAGRSCTPSAGTRTR